MSHNFVEFDADLGLHFSHNDHLPFGRTEAPARSRNSLMQRPHESLGDVRSRIFGRRLTLPGIEVSDVESDVRPRLLGKIFKNLHRIMLIYQCFD